MDVLIFKLHDFLDPIGYPIGTDPWLAVTMALVFDS
jgi:hypothetical protein